MSQRHVEILREVYERWGQGDFQAGEELYDEEVTLVLRPEFPEPGEYHGTEEIRRYMREDFLQDFDQAAISGEEFIGAGDRVVVRVRQSATGPASGAPIEMGYFQVWTFRGSRVIRIESIRERDQALEAAGLPRAAG